MSEINYNINLDYDPENEELAVILNNADNFCNALELADKASAVMNETEEQKIVASNVNDNQEGENPPSPKGGAATKAVEENTVNENARDISQPLTVEDIVKSKQLSPEMLAEIINAAKNDNLFPVDNLDGKELTDKR